MYAKLAPEGRGGGGGVRIQYCYMWGERTVQLVPLGGAFEVNYFWI